MLQETKFRFQRYITLQILCVVHISDKWALYRNYKNKSHVPVLQILKIKFRY